MNQQNIDVEYNIGDTVVIVGSTRENKIIGYEYVPPAIKYVLLDGESGAWGRCLAVEIERASKPGKIGFNIKKSDESTTNN